MTRCTGACCESIVLHHTAATEAGLICCPRAWLRTWIERDQDEEAARIWRVLRFVRTREDGAEVHRCAALGPAGCLIARDDRPEMCTRFPYGGDNPCHYCGAQSDAEARGVAMARVM